MEPKVHQRRRAHFVLDAADSLFQGLVALQSIVAEWNEGGQPGMGRRQRSQGIVVMSV